MIYRIKMVSDEATNFYRVLEIDSDSTFLQLRNAILDCVDYTHDCIDSFAMCNDEWQPNEEIALEDLGLQSSDRDLYLMGTTSLSELIEDEGQKLAFIFDNLNERAFFMEVKEIIPGKHLDEPRCVARQGKAPSQEMGLMPELNEVKKDTTDIFSDFGFDADEGYDEDDFKGLEEKDSLE